MGLGVRNNLDECFAQLEHNMSSAIPLGTAIALTATIKDCQAAIQDEMRTQFDRPTPWTINSVRIEIATPDKLRARVFIGEDLVGGQHTPYEYLRQEFDGGVRLEKGSEAILRSTGLLPPQYSIVPGAGARLDQYGNISPGLLQQVLSALRVSETLSGRTSNRPLVAKTARQKRQRAKQGEFFVSRTDNPHGRHLRPGIYRRLALTLKPIIMFVRQPSYRARIDFTGVAQATAEAVLPGHLKAQFARRLQRLGS